MRITRHRSQRPRRQPPLPAARGAGPRRHGGWRRGARRTVGDFQYLSCDLDRRARASPARSPAARPEVVIHPASMTEVDACERNPRRGLRRQRHSPPRTWRGTPEASGAHLVHVSTDYVFDGAGRALRRGGAAQPARRLRPDQAAWARRPCALLAGSWAIARTAVVYGWPAVGAPQLRHLAAGRAAREARRCGSSTTSSSRPASRSTSPSMLAELAERQARRHLEHLRRRGGQPRAASAKRCASVFGFDRRLLVPSTLAELGWPARGRRSSGLRGGQGARAR